jgi:hypothetical protein
MADQRISELTELASISNGDLFIVVEDLGGSYGDSKSYDVTPLVDAIDKKHAQVHDLGGSDHNAATLAELNAKVSDATLIDTGDSRLTDSREWSADTVSQADAEAGTSTDRKAWTAERVKQAIDALGAYLTFSTGLVDTDDTITVDFGTTAGKVCQGNDSRLHTRSHSIDGADDHASMTADRIVGRVTSAGTPQQLTAAQVKTMCSIGTMAERAMTISTSAPSGGSNGDVWFVISS